MTGKDMTKRCELCQEAQWRYRCPGCLVKTCSLPCVRQHKANTGCTGQRDKTAYVALKEFTDLNLLNDYRFLEDAGRQNNNATRDDIKRTHFKPGFLKELEKQASLRKINLRLMPYPMTRRKNNYTTYQSRSKTILWQIEWKFPQSDLTIVDKRVPEISTLGSILEGHMTSEADPLRRHKLRPYIQGGTDKWAVYLQVEDLPQSQPRYHKLDLNKSVTENLSGKCVIEYPTLSVVLKTHWDEYNTDMPPKEKQNPTDYEIVESEKIDSEKALSASSLKETKVADSNINQPRTSVVPTQEEMTDDSDEDSSSDSSTDTSDDSDSSDSGVNNDLPSKGAALRSGVDKVGADGAISKVGVHAAEIVCESVGPLRDNNVLSGKGVNNVGIDRPTTS